MTKTHLADSAEPLKEGTTIKAKCELDVPNSVFALEFFAEGGRQTVRDALGRVTGLCFRCRRKRDELKERYVYCIRSGEENMQAETL